MSLDREKYEKFVAERGYVPFYEKAYTITRDIVARNGVTYKTARAMFNEYGQYPVFKKDDVCYGYLEPGEIEGYGTQ
jgi:hypothetical protein